MEIAEVPHHCFDRLVELVKTLRGDQGCPWDRAQTPETIQIYLIEEAYEVLDALESGPSEEVCAELGDLLFHIIFLARLFEEKGAFDISHVIRGIVGKMTRRHPHVFGKARVHDVDDVKKQWHKIKAAESSKKASQKASPVHGVSERLPVLMRAYRLAERASRGGLGWPDMDAAFDHVEALLAQCRHSMNSGKGSRGAEKMGDLLFAIAGLSRFVGVHPETALGLAIGRFTRRFKCVEEGLRQQGRTMESASRQELEGLWEACEKDRASQSQGQIQKA